jgi:transcriptional regulator with XRE-family HTH domain
VIVLYERIRNLREDKNLTQKQVAEHLNCSQRIYSNYERGEVDIPTGILIKLADLHNTSTDYILGRTKRKEAYPKS